MLENISQNAESILKKVPVCQGFLFPIAIFFMVESLWGLLISYANCFPAPKANVFPSINMNERSYGLILPCSI